MNFYISLYIFIYLHFIYSVSIPLNAIPAGQIISATGDMIPLQNKLGTAGNVVKNLIQGKNPILPVKANYHKFKMNEAYQKQQSYQEKLQIDLNLSKHSASNTDTANDVYQYKTQYYQAIKNKHAKKYQNYKEKDKNAKSIWSKNKII